jgi:hypothetical protein
MNARRFMDFPCCSTFQLRQSKTGIYSAWKWIDRRKTRFRRQIDDEVAVAEGHGARRYYQAAVRVLRECVDCLFNLGGIAHAGARHLNAHGWCYLLDALQVCRL